MSERRFGVIGGGSWATAIVKMLTNNLDQVNWWMRNEKSIEYIQTHHHNPKYIRSAEFNVEKLNLSSDIASIVSSSDIIILATPSAFLNQVLSSLDKSAFQNKTVISAIKGIIPETNEIPADYMINQFNVPENLLGMISGPCHAEEVAMERLSYLTISSPDKSIAEVVASALSCRYIKTTTSDDLYGTELGAILKNVFAIAAGICHGIGYGDNFQAVLMSNSIQELERFVDKVSPVHRDVKGSAYLGDLLVTGYSLHSRNRRFGNYIGRGYSVDATKAEMRMVAEGYYAVKCIMDLNQKHQVDLPITESVFHILYEDVPARMEMRALADKLT
jgi:glycerol-3-phosphate dehydrogenase (NAD(P)+)